jgi:hypothetical protein
MAFFLSALVWDDVVDLAAGAGVASCAKAGPTPIASDKSTAATMDDLVILFLLIARTTKSITPDRMEVVPVGIPARGGTWIFVDAVGAILNGLAD